MSFSWVSFRLSPVTVFTSLPRQLSGFVNVAFNHLHRHRSGHHVRHQISLVTTTANFNHRLSGLPFRLRRHRLARRRRDSMAGLMPMFQCFRH